MAFASQPESIYLLTDGDFSGPGNEKVVAWCKQKSADGKFMINTIAVVPKDSRDNPQDLEFVKVLQAIAANSGGMFGFIGDEKQQSRQPVRQR